MCQMCTIGKDEKNLAEDGLKRKILLLLEAERKNDPSLITTSTTHTTTQ